MRIFWRVSSAIHSLLAGKILGSEPWYPGPATQSPSPLILAKVSSKEDVAAMFYVLCHRTEIWIGDTNFCVIMSSQDVVSICWEVILRLQRIWPIKVAGIVAGKCWCLTFDYSKLCGIVFPKIFEFASEDRTVSVRPIRGSEETSRNPHQDQQDLGCFKPDPGPSDVLSVSQYFVWAEQQGGGSGNDA